MLDLYGPVRSVAIVSSTRLEESEGTQPPSPSSDTGSEGEEEDEGEDHGLRVRGCSRACCIARLPVTRVVGSMFTSPAEFIVELCVYLMWWVKPAVDTLCSSVCISTPGPESSGDYAHSP